jgi:hypothetical protein
MIPMFRVFSSGKVLPFVLAATFIFLAGTDVIVDAGVDSSITWLKPGSNPLV